eukprot:3000176-Rhodomonas_salina.2
MTLPTDSSTVDHWSTPSPQVTSTCSTVTLALGSTMATTHRAEAPEVEAVPTSRGAASLREFAPEPEKAKPPHALLELAVHRAQRSTQLLEFLLAHPPTTKVILLHFRLKIRIHCPSCGEAIRPRTLAGTIRRPFSKQGTRKQIFPTCSEEKQIVSMGCENIKLSKAPRR